MASSTTEIANLALNHLGVGAEITALDTERSNEAAACRRFYDQARDEVLRDFPWPFARRYADLGLVEEDPNDEWAYAYRYPTNCLFLRRIFSGDRKESTRIVYQVGQDDDGLLIYTDEADASVEYTIREDDPLRYPPDFVNALALRLASYIAPRVTGGDPFGLGGKALKGYAAAVLKAQANALNEQQSDEAQDAEWIRERNT